MNGIVATSKANDDGTTTVVVTADREADQWHEVLRGSRTLKAMREKGVPVIGAISILSVEFGQLTMRLEEDLDGDQYVYTWVGPTDRMVIPAPPCTSEFDWRYALNEQAKRQAAIAADRAERNKQRALIPSTPEDDDEL